MANADSSTKPQEVAATISETAAVAEKIDLEPNLPTDCPANEDKLQQPNVNEMVEPAELADSHEKEINKENVDQDTEDTEILHDEVAPEEETVEKKTDDTEDICLTTKRSVEKKVDEEEVISSKKLKIDSQQEKINDGIVCEE